MSKTSNFLLRIALAFAFLYPAYGFWTNPNDWLGYIPLFVRTIGFSQDVLLMLIAGLHLVLALWILSGWRIFIPSLGLSRKYRLFQLESARRAVPRHFARACRARAGPRKFLPAVKNVDR